MNSINLPRGRTSYELAGEGPLLVLVHGLSTPAFVWDEMVPLLHQFGFQTLRYDLYGRGGSAAGHRTYDAQLYSDQLFDLLDALELEEPFNLVGYSMGGGIVACAAAAHPARIRSVTLLAPTGFKTRLEESWSVLQIPYYGWIHMEMFGGAHIRMSARAEAKKLGLTSDMGELQARATYKPGFMRAVRKSISEGPMTGLEKTHQKLNDADIPMLAIWGDQDTVIPISGHATLSEINPKAQQHILEDAGHAIAYTHHDQIVAKMSAFLGGL